MRVERIRGTDTFLSNPFHIFLTFRVMQMFHILKKWIKYNQQGWDRAPNWIYTKTDELDCFTNEQHNHTGVGAEKNQPKQLWKIVLWLYTERAKKKMSTNIALYLLVCFSHRYGLALLKLCVLEPISKYTVDNETQVFHGQRQQLK